MILTLVSLAVCVIALAVILFWCAVLFHIWRHARGNIGMAIIFTIFLSAFIVIFGIPPFLYAQKLIQDLVR